jgi:hypothetical protein
MADSKAKRDRSPAFPLLSLNEAVERLTAFERYFGRHPASLEKAGLAWGLKQFGHILAALRYFGFIEYVGESDARHVVVTDEGRNLLRTQQPSVRQEMLRKAALRPKEFAKFWAKWGADRPPDPVCLDELMLRNEFSQRGAPLFLRSYDATITFAGLMNGAKIDADSAGAETEDANELPPVPQPPRQVVKVGDYVQWTNGGQDQFPSPRRVNWVSDDGTHVRVFGSMTGISTEELTMADSPKPAQPKSVSSAYAGDDGELSVLLRGKRLEITADVDRAGLQRLKEILTKYEEILELIDPTSQ